jgi:regulatory protein
MTDDSETDATSLPGNIDRALAARALAWLAQREYSRQELRIKLMRHRPQPGRGSHGGEGDAGQGTRGGPALGCLTLPEVDPADGRSQAQRVSAVLDWLERNQHLSQQRFAESRIHSRSERFGNARIRQELAQHGVALPVELEASLQASEFARARAVWQRKFGGCSVPASTNEDARQFRFLAGRGFSGDVIRRVLRNVETTNAIDQPLKPGAHTSAPAAISHTADIPAHDVHPRAGSRLRVVVDARQKPSVD